MAQNVLEELPKQLTEYMTSMNIKPNPPQQMDSDVSTVYKRQETAARIPSFNQRN